MICGEEPAGHPGKKHGKAENQGGRRVVVVVRRTEEGECLVCHESRGWRWGGDCCVCGNGRRRGRSPSSPDMGGGKKAPPAPSSSPPPPTLGATQERRNPSRDGGERRGRRITSCTFDISWGFVRIRKFVFVEECNKWGMEVKKSANDLLKVKRGKGNALGAAAAFPLSLSLSLSALPPARFLFLFSLTKKLKLGSRRRKKSRLRRRPLSSLERGGGREEAAPPLPRSPFSFNREKRGCSNIQ